MLYKNNDAVDFLEVKYTTPTGCRGCYRFVMDTTQYINTSFFAVKTQIELKQVFEVITLSADASENFAAIENFYRDAIQAAKTQYWFKWYEHEKNSLTAAITERENQLKYYMQLQKVCAPWDKDTINKKIDSLQESLHSWQFLKDGLLKRAFMKEHAKERHALERLEKNYKYFLKYIEKLSSGKKSRRRAA